MDLTDRWYGKYRCDGCGKTWKSIDASEEYQECHDCNEDARRIMVRPLKYHDIPENKRLFGKFNCERCDRSWQSAIAWKRYKQQCTYCKKFTRPYYLNRLEYQGDCGDPKKPHLQKYCGKCQKLGHSCLLETESDDSSSG